MDTKRQAIGQLVLCKGCCCGRTDRGRPDVPVDRVKDVWQREKLNRTVQLTVSGCLGPCDLANVALVILPDCNVWLGGMAGAEVYERLVAWARSCHAAGGTLPLPEELRPLRFERFRPAGAAS